MARKLITGMAKARRTTAGLSKVSMTLPAELAWRLRVKATMAGIGLGDLCAEALRPLVLDDHLPWDRYRPKPASDKADGRQDGIEGTGENQAVETLPITEDIPPPAPARPRRGGHRGKPSPAELRSRIDRRNAS